MTKPTVYLDTSLVSAYWYEGGDVALLARRFHTREWWDIERRHFSVLTSGFSEGELRAGRFPRQRDCLKMVRRLGYLSATATSRELAKEIVRLAIVPPNKATDAAHLATAAVHGVDYLLTWNYSHMANPVVQRRLEALCEATDLTVPLLVSPESIPQVRFGQHILRSQ